MTVKIQDILVRDPKKEGLANDGQARIRNEESSQADHELRAELSSFVSDGQYGRAMERILSGYLKHLTRDRQLAAWISGFYGSGKSHLLKMLGHLWQNTTFSDGSAARGLVVGLPSEVAAHLQELDQTAKRLGVSRFAAMGQLPAGSGEFVRATIASIVLGARKLPTQVPLAEFVFWLRDQGIAKTVEADVEKAGKNWLRELESLYVSPLIASAVIKAMPSFAASEADARRAFAAQYPALKQDVDSHRFIKVIRSALEENGQLPLSIIVLDEVQQYIGDSPQRAADVTEAVETLYTKLDCRALVIGAGQSALSTNTPTLLRLRDRFSVTVELSDTDVEAVTRRVVLSKKPSHVTAIKSLLDRHAGEIERHLKTVPRLAARRDDERTIVTDYPLLPTRRRFWEECFRAVDAQGSESQLRSQLKVIHSSVLDCADKELGYVIPGDALYTRIADKLVNTRVLLNELFNRIEKLKEGPQGNLRCRACGLVFLINKLPREAGVDLGLRATAEVLADLMIEDITAPSGPFRNQIAEILEGLSADGTLMKVGDEYRLQTTEGAEWDRAFRERVAGLTAQPDEIEAIRRRRFLEEAQNSISTIRMKHGTSKTPRSVTMHCDDSPPPKSDSVVIWMRDEWGTSEREVLNSARTGGVDDSTVHVFIPKKEADSLRRYLAESEAAQRVLDNKGAPTNPEGEEARASMISRKTAAESGIQEAVKEIFRGAKVFQGGGHELAFANLSDALNQATTASVEKLYPRFTEADSSEWSRVIQRAREGNDNPFSPVGFSGPVQDHAVSREVMRAMGQGVSGSKIRKTLEAPPFGWPKDAIDASLIALHRGGVVRVTQKGANIAPGALDQNNIQTAEFRPEATIVTTKDRITVKSVCAYLGVKNVRNGEEEMRSGEALKSLADLGRRAGGSAPLPDLPDIGLLNDLTSKSGGERLVTMSSHEKEIKALWDNWKIQVELIEKRQPAWDRVTRLVSFGKFLPELDDARSQLEAIKINRSLLAEPDPVAPILLFMVGVIRNKLLAIHARYADTILAAQTTLDADANWLALKPEQQTKILVSQKLDTPEKPSLSSDDALLATLETASLETRADWIALVPTRVGNALAEAARLTKPASRILKFPPVTLETTAQVESWFLEKKKQLLEEIKKGPVILG